MTHEAIAFSSLARARGRAQWIAEDGSLYVSRGYAVHRSRDGGRTWSLDSVVRVGPLAALLSRLRLAARATRQYIAGLVVLPGGARVAVAREGIYRAEPGRIEMRRVFRVVRGSRPVHIGCDDEGRVFFGEYGPNPERGDVHLYVAEPGSDRFEVAHTFRAGEIRHVHNVLFDPFARAYWVLVGDYGHEPGIGITDRTFARIEWIVRGTQDARVVGAIVEKDCLLYGTDTEIEPNRIVRLDKATGRKTSLQPVEGTSFHATVFGGVRLISTVVEPSGQETPEAATVWASLDGDRFTPLASFRKDALPLKLFQYGTVVLPPSRSLLPRGMWSGQAVQGLDGRVQVVELRPGI